MEFVIDFETLGVKPTAHPLNIGITAFELSGDLSVEWLKDHSKLIKLDYNDVSSYKCFTKDKKTIEWWKKQDAKLKKITFTKTKDDVKLLDSLHLIKKFMLDNGYEYDKSYMFFRGQDFDAPIFKNLYEVCGLEFPFNRFKFRDIRTYIDILGGVDNGFYDVSHYVGNQFDKLPKHLSVSDTIRDAYTMIYLYKEFTDSFNDEDLPF